MGGAPMKKLLALTLISLLLAPRPWGIALNHGTKECAGFWGGDEYGSFELPPDWVAYYPNADGIIETEIGSCRFTSSRQYQAAEPCCDELGYTFVDPNIGIGRTSPLLIYALGATLCKGFGLVCAGGLALALIFGGWLLWRRRRRKHLGARSGPRAS
jgi:hypothetical protein